MIKMFNEFASKDLLKKRLYQKIGKFFESIKLENHNVGDFTWNNTFVKAISNKDSSEIYFAVTFDIEFWKSIYPSANEYYNLLHEYILYKLKQFCEVEVNSDHVKLKSKLTYDIIKKIKFDKEEYEIFEDTERFGL